MYTYKHALSLILAALNVYSTRALQNSSIYSSHLFLKKTKQTPQTDYLTKNFQNIKTVKEERRFLSEKLTLL